METFISGILDKKVDEVFLEIQEHFGITNGDVRPEDAYELSEKLIEVSTLIGRIVRLQKGELCGN